MKQCDYLNVEGASKITLTFDYYKSKLEAPSISRSMPVARVGRLAVEVTDDCGKSWSNVAWIGDNFLPETNRWIPQTVEVDASRFSLLCLQFRFRSPKGVVEAAAHSIGNIRVEVSN